MNTQEIRDLWTRFFAAREHRAVPSSSLIPPPDERSLLFTNAGMNQMKPFFMGLTEAAGPAADLDSEVLPHLGHRRGWRQLALHLLRDAGELQRR